MEASLGLYIKQRNDVACKSSFLIVFFCIGMGIKGQRDCYMDFE